MKSFRFDIESANGSVKCEWDTNGKEGRISVESWYYCPGVKGEGSKFTVKRCTAPYFRPSLVLSKSLISFSKQIFVKKIELIRLLSELLKKYERFQRLPRPFTDL